ncbi:hypothetical protein EXW96_09010 [Paenibacillus sp. JMULE4]|nr:helix-turn-helix domain-containing protein [Paenibacillus sp. JMULE4]NTZ17704.1 hypothetical protein [Paenibacillus sp. JMULE4]
MQTMMRYHWPGNIRELVNVLERLSVLSRGENLSGLDIRSLFGNASDCGENPDFAESPNRDPAALNYQKRVQKDQIIWALEQTGGNVSKSAKLLALPRSTFYRRLRTFKLDQL